MSNIIKNVAVKKVGIISIYGKKINLQSCPMRNEPKKLIKVGYQAEIVQNLGVMINMNDSKLDSRYVKTYRLFFIAEKRKICDTREPVTGQWLLTRPIDKAYPAI